MAGTKLRGPSLSFPFCLEKQDRIPPLTHTHTHTPVSILKACSIILFLTQEEDEVPDDETLNQMIARREEEFDLFMVMLQ